MPDPQQQSDDFSDMDALMTRETVRQKAAQYGLRVSSGVRSPQSNARAGGAPHSSHLTGNATDYVGDPQAMKAFTDDVAATPGLRELYHGSVGFKNGQQVAPIAGHDNHVHVAWQGAPIGKQSKVKAAPDDFSDMDEIVGRLQPKAQASSRFSPAQPAQLGASDTLQPAQEAYRGNPFIGQQQPTPGVTWADTFKENKQRRIQAQRPPIRMTLPGQSNEELRAAAASTPSAIEEARREATNQTISRRLGVPLPRIATEALADISGGLASGVGAAVSGEAKPSVFNPLKSLALQLPGVQGALDKTVGAAGQALQEQGQQASQVAGAGGIRGDVGRAVGGLAPMLAAKNPLIVGALAYDQARGQGLSEAEAIKEGAISGVSVAGMGGAAKVINRMVPGAGVIASGGRFAGRALANALIPAEISEGFPDLWKAIKERRIPDNSNLPAAEREARRRRRLNEFIMGTGFAAIPHAVESAKPRLSPREAYEQQRLMEEQASPIYPPVKPTEQGVEAALEQGLSARQTLASPRLIKQRAQDIKQSATKAPPRFADTQSVYDYAETLPSEKAREFFLSYDASGPAEPIVKYAERYFKEESPSQQPVSFDESKRQQTMQTPTPTGETGLEGLDVQQPNRQQSVAPAAGPAVVPVPRQGGEVVTRANEQPDATIGTQSTAFTPGDVIKAAKGGINWRVEATEGDSLRVRPLNQAGNPAGRARLLKQFDLQGFSKTEVKPQAVKPIAPQNRSVKPESDTLLSAIQKIGFDSTTPEGQALAQYLSVREGGRPGMVRNTKGAGGQTRGVDNLVRELEGHGFDFGDGVKAKKSDVLLDLARQEQAGKPVYSHAYDHAAQAEREIQAQLDAEHSAPVKRQVITLVQGVKKNAEFGELSDKIAHGEASNEEIKRFAEIGKYELNVSPDAIESFLEESANAQHNQGRGAESGIESQEPPVSAAQRGAIPAGQQEGDVDGGNVRPSQSVVGGERGPSPANATGIQTGNRISNRERANAGLGTDSNRAASGKRQDTVAFTPTAGTQLGATADQLSRVAETLDQLKRQSAETGQSLASLVEDRIDQQALPGMESAALSTQDADLLRQMAAPTPRRAPVKEQQAGFEGMDVAPTVESKQAQATAAEQTATTALANSPLFEGKGEPQIPEGYKRLYRGETTNPNGKGVPDWIKDNPDYQATKDATGRWFYGTRAEAESFAKDFGESDKVSYVDVPEGDYETYRVSNQPEIAKHTGQGRAGEEFFVPKDIAERRQPHHSNFQPRDESTGQFKLEEPPQPPAKGEHGQFINSLFKSPDVDANIPAFWANPEVRAKLGLPRLGKMAETKDALAKAMGLPRSSHISPEALRAWATENGLGQDALTAIDSAHATYKAYLARQAKMKETQGGFIRFGGNAKQYDLSDLFKTKDRVPVDEAHDVMHDAWDEFTSEPSKRPNAPRAGEAYYENKPAEKDKLLSFRTLDSWMKANMLQGLSPYSHKVGSLASNAMAEAASTPTAAAADWIISKAQGGRRSVVVDPKGMAKAAASAVTTGTREALQIMRQGATKEQIEKYGMPNQLNTRNPVVNALVNYTFRSYKAGAHIFGTMAYQKALNNQAKAWALNEVTAGKIGSKDVARRTQEILDGKGVPTGVTATMEGNAILAYADAVFQSDNALNNIRKKFIGDGNGAWAFAVNRVVPFMKSASNAYLKMLDYTGVGPKGAAAETIRAIQRKASSGQAFKTLEDQRAFATAWGKLPVGLVLFTAGVALHRHGLLTSLTYQHDDNPQPGSVRVAGKLVDVARYSPIGLIMAAGATFDELSHDKGDDALTAAVKVAGKGASNLPMFSQTTDLIKTAQALSEGKSSVPGVIGAAGKALVTKTAPTMIPGYATARDIKAGIEQSDKYVAGPLGKVLHVRNELKPPRSQAEVKAAATVKAHMPAMGEMTPEKKERFELKKQITDLAKKGDMDGAVKVMAEGLKSGKLAEDDARDIDERTKLDYLQYQVKKLNAQDALSIYFDKRTTPEERERIASIIEDKLNRFDVTKHPQREVDALMPQVMEFVKSRPQPAQK